MKMAAQIGLVVLMALSAMSAGSSASILGDPVREFGSMDEGEQERTSFHMDLCYVIDRTICEGREYSRIIIEDGGIEPGPHGEERPFVRYFLRTEGRIDEIEVDMEKLIMTSGEIVPYMVPGILGEEATVHPRWKDGTLPSWDVDWKLTEIGMNGDGYEYSLKVHPAVVKNGRIGIYTSIDVSCDLVENSFPIASSWLPPSGKPLGDIDYLMITHKDLVDAVRPLAEWKTQKGLFSLLYTTEEIDGMYEDGDLASKMRSLVMELEKKYDLDHLLLAGDYDKVPTRMTHNAYPATQYGEPSTFASDSYFACVDDGTTWNTDGDKRFAEPGEIDDAIPDLAVGRLAINDPKIMTDKITELIEREKDPRFDEGMLTAALMGGDNQNVPGSSADFMDHQWETYWEDVMGSRETIYFDGSGSLSFSSSSVKKVLDDNSQFLAYFSHGRFDSLPDLFSRSDVQNLDDNGSGGLLFAMACVTGWFDKGTGGMISGTGDCFAEAMTETPDKGVVGYIGACRLASGACDTTYSGDAPGLQEDYFRAVRMALSGELEPTVGAIYREAEKRFSTSFYPFPNNQNDVSARTFQEYNLLGEPDAPLILKGAGELNLEYTLSPDRSSLKATVTNKTDDPAPNVVVTLTRLEELGICGLTDENGEVEITIPESNGGNVTVTAYKPGDRPAQASFMMEDRLSPTGGHVISPEEPDGRNGYYVTYPVIRIIGDEPVTMEYRWNGGEAVLIGPDDVVEAAEGNNTLEYRVRDMAGHLSTWYVFNISVDTIPPDIEAVVDPVLPDGENGYYRTGPKVSLVSDDAVLDMQYQLDALPRSDLDGEVQVPDGEHEVRLWASDPAGNVGTTNVTLKVDTEAPFSGILLSHLPDGDNGYYVTAPSVELYSEDGAARIQYRWDDDEWQDYGSPLTVEEGDHILRHRSFDPAGNVEDERYMEFLVDTTEPTLDISIEPYSPDGTNDYHTVTPEIEAASDSAAVLFSIVPMGEEPGEDLSWSPLNGSLSVPDGEWTIFVRARDEAGNEITSDPIDIKVDTGIPDVFWNISPLEPPTPENWYPTSPTLSVSTTHNDAVLSWKYLNGEDWLAYEKPFELGGGIHAIHVRSVDRAGNEMMQELPEIKVDLDAPWVDILFMENGTVYGNEDVLVRWDGGDDTSEPTFLVKVDGDSWREPGAENSTLLEGLGDGSHSIALKVTDQAGREMTVWRTFRIDATAPYVVDITPSGNENPANSVVEVLFSEEMDRGTVSIAVTGVQGSVSWRGNTIVFSPAEGLQYGTDYRVTVSGSDIHGNPMEEFTHKFSTYAIVVNDTPEQDSKGNGSLIIPALIGVGLVSLLIGAGTAVIVMRRRTAVAPEE
ncbi:MAG: C25 family cysteine peptidase [Thermoplasmatota archaeon]